MARTLVLYKKPRSYGGTNFYTTKNYIITFIHFPHILEKPH